MKFSEVTSPSISNIFSFFTTQFVLKLIFPIVSEGVVTLAGYLTNRNCLSNVEALISQFSKEVVPLMLSKLIKVLSTPTVAPTPNSLVSNFKSVNVKPAVTSPFKSKTTLSLITELLYTVISVIKNEPVFASES